MGKIIYFRRRVLLIKFVIPNGDQTPGNLFVYLLPRMANSLIKKPKFSSIIIQTFQIGLFSKKKKMHKCRFFFNYFSWDIFLARRGRRKFGLRRPVAHRRQARVVGPLPGACSRVDQILTSPLKDSLLKASLHDDTWSYDSTHI